MVRSKCLHIEIGQVIFPGSVLFALVQTIWQKVFPERIYFICSCYGCISPDETAKGKKTRRVLSTTDLNVSIEL